MPVNDESQRVLLAPRDTCFRAQDADAGQFVIATLPSGVLARWGTYLAALAGEEVQVLDDIEFLCAHGFATGADADGLTVSGTRLVAVHITEDRYEVLFGEHVLFTGTAPATRPPVVEDVLLIVVPGTDAAPGLDTALELTSDGGAAAAMARCVWVR